MKSATFSIICLLYYFASSHAAQLSQTNDVPNLEARELVNINGSYYYISEIRADYYGALLTCNDFNMKLLSIQSEEKQNLIADYLDNNGHLTKNLWLSGIRVYRDKFMWSGTGELFSYVNWSSEEPNEPADQVDVCVGIGIYDYRRKWYDLVCTELRNFLCEQIV